MRQRACVGLGHEPGWVCQVDACSCCSSGPAGPNDDQPSHCILDVFRDIDA